MKNKNSRLALSLMALSLATATTENEYHKYAKPKHYRKRKPNFDQIIIRESKLNEEQTMAKKGMKKFYYGENYVFAINKKNADKKAIKLGFI